MSKQTILLLFGGALSSEHAVSILSAQSVYAALDLTRYAVHVVYINRAGQWRWIDPTQPSWTDQADAPELLLYPAGPGSQFCVKDDPSHSFQVDCVLPIMHGAEGEDGVIQGVLSLMRCAYVGADLVGSVLCMHKALTKQTLKQFNLPVVDWIEILPGQPAEVPTYDEVVAQLGTPFFVKPVSQGSSIGVSCVRDSAAYSEALETAGLAQSAVLVERAVVGREIECSVLGGASPRASLPGEFVTSHDFYSYVAKYHDGEQLVLKTPADLPADMISAVQSLALRAFAILRCRGLARVDFFLSEAGELWINEVNTLPGFTAMSLYPKNFEASGLSYAALLDQLIEIALADHRQDTQAHAYYLGCLANHVDTKESVS